MFQLPVADIFHLGRRTVLTGTVLGGVVSIGDRVKLESPRASFMFTVGAIERDKKIIPTANIGESIAILAEGIDLATVADGFKKLDGGGYKINALVIRGVPPRWWEFWK